MNTKFSMLFSALVLFFASVAQAQMTKKQATVISVGTGTGAYLRLRGETIYKNSTPGKMTAKEISDVLKKIELNDKVVVRAGNGNFWSQLFNDSYQGKPFASQSVQSPSKASYEELLTKSNENPLLSIKSIRKIGNKITISAINKAGLFDVTLIAAAVTSGVYALSHQDGEVEAQDNSGRAVVESEPEVITEEASLQKSKPKAQHH